MTNASKIKGNSAERQLCKILQKFFNQPFQRVPSSGGMLGGMNNPKAKKLSKNQQQLLSNDIIPPECFPKLNIECKFYKDFSFNMLMDPKGYAQLNEWIEQVWESGIDMEASFPMICFKINNKGWHTVVWSDKIKNLDLKGINYTVYNHKDVEYKIFQMENFIERYTEELKQYFS